MIVELTTKVELQHGQKVLMDDGQGQGLQPYYVNHIGNSRPSMYGWWTLCDIQPSDMTTGGKANVIATLSGESARAARNTSNVRDNGDKTMAQTQTNGSKKLKPLNTPTPVKAGGKSGSAKSGTPTPVKAGGKSGAAAAGSGSGSAKKGRRSMDDMTFKEICDRYFRRNPTWIAYTAALVKANEFKGSEKMAERLDEIAKELETIYAQAYEKMPDNGTFEFAFGGGGGAPRGPRIAEGATVKIKDDKKAAWAKWLGGDKELDALEVTAVADGKAMVKTEKGKHNAIIPVRELELVAAAESDEE